MALPLNRGQLYFLLQLLLLGLLVGLACWPLNLVDHVQDLLLQQHQRSPVPALGSEEEALVWAHHPSRVDVFGMASCPSCQRPAPAGELQRWGHCSFCQRERMDNGVAMGTRADV